MSAWARWVEIADQRRYATVHIVEWTDVSPADGTTYITIHATEPPLGVDLPTPPAVVMDGQDPLIGDDT